MGRRPVGPEVSVRMPEEMIRTLDECCRRLTVTRSELIRQAVAQVWCGSPRAQLLAAATVVERHGRSLPAGSRRDRMLHAAHELRRAAL